MKPLSLALACLVSSTAWADDPPPPPPPADGSAQVPTTPPPDAPPAPPAEPVAEPTPPPPPPPTPTPTPTPAPAPTPPAPAPVAVTKHDDKPFVDDYYDRKRGIGMFHQARLAIGALQGTTPNLMDGMVVTPGATKDVTQGELAFEAVFLGLPSSYGHFHGIEVSSGLRSTPIDFWAQFGSAVSLFNIGRG